MESPVIDFTPKRERICNRSSGWTENVRTEKATMARKRRRVMKWRKGWIPASPDDGPIVIRMGLPCENTDAEEEEEGRHTDGVLKQAQGGAKYLRRPRPPHRERQEDGQVEDVGDEDGEQEDGARRLSSASAYEEGSGNLFLGRGIGAAWWLNLPRACTSRGRYPRSIGR